MVVEGPDTVFLVFLRPSALSPASYCPPKSETTLGFLDSQGSSLFGGGLRVP